MSAYLLVQGAKTTVVLVLFLRLPMRCPGSCDARLYADMQFTHASAADVWWKQASSACLHTSTVVLWQAAGRKNMTQSPKLPEQWLHSL